jgi:ribosomal protein L11 methyltransferase
VPLSWIEISVRVTAGSQGAAERLFNKHAALAVTASGASTDVCFQQDTADMPYWESTNLTGLFAADCAVEAITGCLRSELQAADADIEVTALEDRDWERESLSQFSPIAVGAGLWVCPSWCVPPAEAETVVYIDPGMAFGTGHHATTWLCLEFIARHPLASGTVVDYGCGSGILGIAALCRGATRVWAIDNDPQALTISSQNARRNGVAGRFTPLRADSSLSDIHADLIVANILFDTLVHLRVRLTSMVSRGGTLLLSGILPEQAHALAHEYAHDFDFEQFNREGWSILVGRKR